MEQNCYKKNIGKTLQKNTNKSIGKKFTKNKILKNKKKIGKSIEKII